MLDPDIISLERQIGLRGSLVDFVRMAWHLVEPGTPYVHNWHVDCVSEHLEAVSARQIRWLIVNIPPGCMKSSLVQVFWPTREWIQDPAHRFMSWSFDQNLTIRDARKALLIMQSGWFKERWGDRFSIAPDVAAREIRNSRGGLRYSTSVKGKAIGWHADTQIIDDPTNPKSLTDVSLQDAIDLATNILPTRFKDHNRSARVVIMQRIDDRDLAGHYEREGGYEILRLPMKYEPKAHSYTSIGGDQRTTEGELLFPARFPEVEVAKIERDLGPMNTAAQLQQRPVPEGGAVFQLSWFREVLPTALPATFDISCQSWDCTFKGTDDSDYVVGQVWGRKGADFYLLDQVRRRMSFSETKAAIVTMRRKWPKATKILIEDKANGPAIVDSLTKDVAGIEAINPEGGKIARANAVTPLYAAGNVHIVTPDAPGYEWVNDWKLEHIAFPRGLHDDQVDAGTQALVWLYENKSNMAAAMAAAKKMGLI